MHVMRRIRRHEQPAHRTQRMDLAGNVHAQAPVEYLDQGQVGRTMFAQFLACIHREQNLLERRLIEQRLAVRPGLDNSDEIEQICRSYRLSAEQWLCHNILQPALRYCMESSDCRSRHCPRLRSPSIATHS